MSTMAEPWGRGERERRLSLARLLCGSVPQDAPGVRSSLSEDDPEDSAAWLCAREARKIGALVVALLRRLSLTLTSLRRRSWVSTAAREAAVTAVRPAEF